MTPIQKRAERVRGVDLESVLRLVGAQPDPEDRHKWHTPEGVLSVTSPKFMNWSRGIGGGGAIDLVIHLHHHGFMEALEWLEQNFPLAASPACFGPALRRSFQRPIPSPEKIWQVQDYLILKRRLPARWIIPLIDSGQIYADARANAVFLLLGEKNNPVGAELRGTTQAIWRGMAPGSQKDRGFFAVGLVASNTLILCESAIDAISCCALFPEARCLSTAGARFHPRWLPTLIKPGVEIYCGFDADPVGDAMSRELIALHPSIRRLRPSQKDWNDVLRSN
jgi:hypothetical protein